MSTTTDSKQETPLFLPTFERRRTKQGMSYTFRTIIPKEIPTVQWCVVGQKSYAAEANLESKCTELPEDVQNPECLHAIFTQWLSDCSGAFVKPPTLSQCINHVTCVVDMSGNILPIGTDEEDDDWEILWFPTVLHLHPPQFQLGWVPMYLKKITRIPSFTDFEPDVHEVQITQPELQLDSRTARTFGESMGGDSSLWMQELTDGQIPFQDSAIVRLHDSHQEKFRKRVYEARMKAKLSRYRADRIAQQYERKYGVWPEETVDEAETDIGSDSDDLEGRMT